MSGKKPRQLVVHNGVLEKQEVLAKFEELRQGFASVLTCEELGLPARVSMESYHKYANMICVELGGESVDTVVFRKS